MSATQNGVWGFLPCLFGCEGCLLRRGGAGGEYEPGNLGRERVPAQGVADGSRRGLEVRGDDGVGADGAGGDLVGHGPDCAFEGGAARGGKEGRWEGNLAGWHCCGFAGFGCCCGGCGGFGDGFGHGGGHFVLFSSLMSWISVCRWVQEWLFVLRSVVTDSDS